jgi:LytS/YehU family sensor histidine kinase
MQKEKNKETNISGLKSNGNGQTVQNPYSYQKLSIKVTLTAIFTALAIGSSYILAPLINIEVMSVLLFIAGFLYGKFIGSFVGLLSSLIYYGWNPFGVSPLPIYLVCVGCMTFIGLVGGLLKPAQFSGYKLEANRSNIVKIALIGFLYTILFDLFTNIVFGLIYYGGNILLAFITGFPFMIIHIVSNTILFALLVLPIYNAVARL